MKSTTSWNLRIIGRGEASFEQELKEKVKELQLEKHVTFLGYVSEEKKSIEMAKAWVLLVPSSREGWGMIVPEANSVGTPAIVYDVPGLCDVAKKYAKENVLSEPNPQALASAIEEIKKPVLVTKKIVPGWSELHSFVKSEMRSLNK